MELLLFKKITNKSELNWNPGREEVVKYLGGKDLNAEDDKKRSKPDTNLNAKDDSEWIKSDSDFGINRIIFFNFPIGEYSFL